MLTETEDIKSDLSSPGKDIDYGRLAGKMGLKFLRKLEQTINTCALLMETNLPSGPQSETNRESSSAVP